MIGGQKESEPVWCELSLSQGHTGADVRMNSDTQEVADVMWQSSDKLRQQKRDSPLSSNYTWLSLFSHICLSSPSQHRKEQKVSGQLHIAAWCACMRACVTHQAIWQQRPATSA